VRKPSHHHLGGTIGRGVIDDQNLQTQTLMSTMQRAQAPL
jgi:hypothetical protein